MNNKIKGYESRLVLSNQVELFKKIIITHLMLENIKLGVSAINILSYYCSFGITKDCENFILDNKIVSSKQILANLKTFLHRKKLIYKHKYGFAVCEDLNFEVNKGVSFMIIKLKAEEIINLTLKID